ncbi:M15 family metallopeptidase [Mangrovimonas aestuarii]|uniref:M15 family metallopeptidase n=1 Tax=Mangrovimonas aestuarii TaxID=3018443 RepID=UPI002378D11F|nr:M15 family metallopeptidase [Mangrovimonas aestuarii]
MKLLQLFLLCFALKVSAQLPDGFVYVDDHVSGVKTELKYSTAENFTGRLVKGYELARKAVVTKATAEALNKVQEELKAQGLGLLIYDAYRPQRAVDDFVKWAKQLNDTINKQVYYPNVDKKDLFAEEYIAERSGHSRGSTLDVTLIDLKTEEPLDMGSTYDMFDPVSWVNYKGITEGQQKNRQLLQSVMLKHGFKNYPREWWHFTLKNEPFTDTYFDFIVP